jgi:hypothetical protein
MNTSKTAQAIAHDVVLGLLALPVVRQRTDPQPPGPDATDRLEHLRPRHARLGDVGHEARAVHRHALSPAVRLERRAKGRDSQLAALQPCPGAGLAGGRHHPVDGVGGQAMVTLVAGDGVQRRVHHHTAQIEEDAVQWAHGAIVSAFRPAPPPAPGP